MAYSVVGIVNIALLRISAPSISSIDEQSEQARKAKALWDYVQDEVQAAFPWPFAKRRAKLAQEVTAPAYDWDYSYAKPTDCLRVLEVKQDDATTSIPYVVEGASILTNTDNADYDLYCGYVKRITDPAQWPPHFVKTMAVRLAADLAVTLKNDRALKNDCLQEYMAYLTEAKGVAASEDYVEDENGSDSWENAGRNCA